MRNRWTGYFFIAPWLIGFVLFAFGPFLVSIVLSFTRYNIVTPPEWIGLANYETLFFHDPLFWKSLWITVKYALVAVPLGIATGVGLALMLNLEVRGIAIYRTLFFLPSIVPIVATSVVFVWILNPQIGLVNGILRSFGIVGPTWLGSQEWAFPSLVLMSLWSVGGSMIIYLAGLKDIPTSLYEAAMVDGAGPLHRMAHITLPLLTPVIFFNLVMGIINAFQFFTQPYVIMNGTGGPNDSTLFYAIHLFNVAWRYLDMGYASAMAWILFLVIMAITLFVFKSHSRWVHYGG